MEKINGVSSWKLTVQKNTDSVRILRAATCEKKAELPEVLFGRPVTCIADHAFDAGREVSEGEPIEICHGISSGEFDNSRLENLTIPETVTKIENYALIKCRSLKQLRLFDNIEYFGADILMNCRKLTDIELFRTSETQGDALAYMVHSLTRELNVTVHEVDGSTKRLIFPEYYEMLTENEPTHFFNFTIEGGGYPYHSVFVKNRLNIDDFDALWEKYISGLYESHTALQLAWQRIRFPSELSAAAEELYWKYLRDHLREALLYAVNTDDRIGLQLLLKEPGLKESDISSVAETARIGKKTELLALLLEKRHRTFSKSTGNSYDL